MRRDLNELVDGGGWKSNPEFAAYLEATETIPDLGEKRQSVKSFFIEAPACVLVNTTRRMSNMSRLSCGQQRFLFIISPAVRCANFLLFF